MGDHPASRAAPIAGSAPTCGSRFARRSSTACWTAPEWSISAVYVAGNTVKHERSANGDPNGPPSGQGKHLWRAKWWTQGSEPGWTANWEDLGRC
jgi:chitodextrinase